jgi:hypothetical protein
MQLVDAFIERDQLDDLDVIGDHVDGGLIDQRQSFDR